MTTCVRKDFIETGRHKGVAAIFISFIACEAGIDGTVDEVVDDVAALLKHQGNNEGNFIHTESGHAYWLVFEGDDPMRHQGVLTDIMSKLVEKELFSPRVIIRCGATRPLEEDTEKFIYDFHVNGIYGGFQPDSFGPAFVMIEVDIKLGTKKWNDLVNKEALFSYLNRAPMSYMLAEHKGTSRCWFDLKNIIAQNEEEDSPYPIHITPAAGLSDEELDTLKGETFEKGFYLG